MLNPPLTAIEVRILGALAEKEATTPDNYPLSLNALTAACNQTTNRDPVMSLGEDAVSEAVVALRRRGLVRAIQPIGSRVTKYQHLMADAFTLDAREVAVLGVLLLRGHQTLGELHARTERLAHFDDLAALEATLEALSVRQPEPLAVRMARRAGQKEARFAHLLSGEPVVADAPEAALTPRPASASTNEASDARVAALERGMDELRAELTSLREQFEAFRANFE